MACVKTIKKKKKKSYVHPHYQSKPQRGSASLGTLKCIAAHLLSNQFAYFLLNCFACSWNLYHSIQERRYVHPGEVNLYISLIPRENKNPTTCYSISKWILISYLLIKIKFQRSTVVFIKCHSHHIFSCEFGTLYYTIHSYTTKMVFKLSEGSAES